MAQIYPQWITDEERRANPGRRAEYLVYDSLKEQLGDQWLVLYGTSIKWVHEFGISDRECEFIVAHPDLGVVAIEVKGGSIEHKDNRWYTTPLSELQKVEPLRRQEEIKNPYTQATNAAKAYRRKIDDYIYTQRLQAWDFEIATAVCFPDIEISTGEYLSPEALPELTLDCRDLPRLKERLYEILKLYGKRSDTIPPGEYGIKILKDVLARDWHIDSFIAYQLQTAEERRKQLTEEQFELLYNLQDISKLMVAGCAGSGKTMIAAKKAQMLARLGKRVLLTCFNENLAAWLNTSDFAHQNIRIAHFHGFCREEIDAAKEVDLPSLADSGLDADTYYGERMPEALELAALERETGFDAVIVDEGQDFKPAWLQVLYNLLADQDQDVFYIFYDDNQRIYNQGRIPFQFPRYRLTRNMRNTNPVFEYVRRYYHSPDAIKPSGIDGPEPWLIPDYEDEYLALQEVLEHLESQRIPLQNIAILTPREREKSRWGRKPAQPGRYNLVWNLHPLKWQVACCTIHSFKGLERPVIILTELEHLYPRLAEELLYVATSRAKDYLVVLGKLPV